MRARFLLLLTLSTPLCACRSAPKEASPAPFSTRTYAVRVEAMEREERRVVVRVPSEAHRTLDSLVGTFRARIRGWSEEGEGSGDPDAPNGTSTNAWIAGGRFMRCELRGSLGSDAFERLSMIGYDRVRECYVETRVDNSTTQMFEVAEGNLSSDERRFVFERDWKDPGLDRNVRLREVLTIEDYDHHRWEQWIDGPGGRGSKLFEIFYERVR